MALLGLWVGWGHCHPHSPGGLIQPVALVPRHSPEVLCPAGASWLAPPGCLISPRPGWAPKDSRGPLPGCFSHGLPLLSKFRPLEPPLTPSSCHPWTLASSPVDFTLWIVPGPSTAHQPHRHLGRATVTSCPNCLNSFLTGLPALVCSPAAARETRPV